MKHSPILVALGVLIVIALFSAIALTIGMPLVLSQI